MTQTFERKNTLLSRTLLATRSTFGKRAFLGILVNHEDTKDAKAHEGRAD
jgi:hypothetical protein